MYRHFVLSWLQPRRAACHTARGGPRTDSPFRLSVRRAAAVGWRCALVIWRAREPRHGSPTRHPLPSSAVLRSGVRESRSHERRLVPPGV